MGCQIFAEVIGDREVMASTEKKRQQKSQKSPKNVHIHTVARTVQTAGEIRYFNHLAVFVIE